jgi:hypothetical protein
MKFDDVFNLDDLPESQSYDPIPAGEYAAEIKTAELRDTKSGNGKYLAIGYSITDQQYNGRMVFGNLNIRNANPKAEEIGRQQLGLLMRAIGLKRLQDSDQLIGGCLKIKVVIKKDDEYGDRNEIKSWKPLAGQSPPATAGGKTPPWAMPSHENADDVPF